VASALRPECKGARPPPAPGSTSTEPSAASNRLLGTWNRESSWEAPVPVQRPVSGLTWTGQFGLNTGLVLRAEAATFLRPRISTRCLPRREHRDPSAPAPATAEAAGESPGCAAGAVGPGPIAAGSPPPRQLKAWRRHWQRLELARRGRTEGRRGETALIERPLCAGPCPALAQMVPHLRLTDTPRDRCCVLLLALTDGETEVQQG
jgi:hypothetical protein